MSQTAQSKPGQSKPGQGGRGRGPPVYGRGPPGAAAARPKELEENLKKKFGYQKQFWDKKLQLEKLLLLKKF